ncbi:uncharacterized protein LOC144302962 isoform X7 [Canis aureus]
MISEVHHRKSLLGSNQRLLRHEKIALLWPRQESGTSLKYLRNTKSPIKGASGVIEGESEEKGHRESTEQVICEEPREAAILT